MNPTIPRVNPKWINSPRYVSFISHSFSCPVCLNRWGSSSGSREAHGVLKQHVGNPWLFVEPNLGHSIFRMDLYKIDQTWRKQIGIYFDGNQRVVFKMSDDVFFFRLKHIETYWNILKQHTVVFQNVEFLRGWSQRLAPGLPWWTWFVPSIQSGPHSVSLDNLQQFTSF